MEVVRDDTAAIGLESGDSGYALAIACVMHTLDDEEGANLLARTVRRSIDHFEGLRLPMSLMHGSVGMAWAMEVLARISPRFPAVDLSEFHNMIEQSALSLHDDFELLAGLAGVALYAQTVGGRLERLELEIVRHLRKLMCTEGQRISFAMPSWSPYRDIDRYRNSHVIDLGVAHGNAGVLIALCGMPTSSCCDDRKPVVRALASLYVQLLERKGVSKMSVGHFLVDGTEVPTAGQLGWCYGDPGVAWALLRAADYVDDHERYVIECYAAEVVQRIDQMTVELNSDLTLCHGVAGAFILGQSLHHSLRRSEGLIWPRRKLDLLDAIEAQESTFGGVLQHRSRDGEHWSREPGLGYLQGEAGVVVALCALEDPSLRFVLEPILGARL